MARVRVVLVDTGIVFRLHEFGLWKQVLDAYEVSVPATVVAETVYYEQGGEKVYIDLSKDVELGRLTVVEMPANEVIEFRSGFRPLYAERLDPGEAEMLAYAMQKGCVHRVCSADAIVYKAMACLGEWERCVSLEKLLADVGMSRKGLTRECTQRWVEEKLAEGKQDALRGVAR